MTAARIIAASALAVALGIAGAAQAATKFPAFSAPVVDAAHVVPDDVEQHVDAELNAYQQRSGNQIAVAVVKTTGGQSIEDYSIDLARAWGVGTKGKDNGVLLLIAYDDHALRIEVGRGLEGTLTDLQSGRIIREQITPQLRNGDVGGAVEAGTTAIRSVLGDAGAVPLESPDNGTGAGGGTDFPWGPVVLFGFIALASAGGGFGRRRSRLGWVRPLLYGQALGGFGRPYGGFGADSFGGGGGSSGGGFGGGGFGGGGFGGGGGGFSGGGGGGFGGGGASGKW